MKNLIAVLVFALVAVSTYAQTGMSGKWKINKEKSTLNEQFSMAPVEITIVQSGNNFEIEKVVNFQDNTMTQKEKYTLDGKECINDGFMDSKKKSTVAVSEDKKTITITSKIPFQENEITTKEVFQIKDGSLVLDSSSASSFGDMSEKVVYTKQ